MNDEIVVCDIFDDEFEKKRISKLIVDGNTNNGTDV
jgi:hypothetical protein